jgi:predicted  nucleic acid-binding Zn-ribbon protein
MNQDTRLEKLQKKYDTEKQVALQDLAAFKAKMNERDQKLAQGFMKKYETLRSELDTTNKKFQERVEQFDAATKNLKRAAEDAAKSGSADVQAQRKQFDEEIAELVRSSNEKYQAMLVEQLGLQSKIRTEMETKLEQLKASLLQQFQKDMQNELGKERALLGGDKQEALMSLRREMEDQIGQQKSAFLAQLEALTGDLKRKSEECESTQKQGAATAAALKGELEALQRSMSDTVGGREAQVAQLSKELSAAKDQLSSAQARVVQREEELAAMRAMLLEKNALLVGMENKAAAAQQELMQLREELDAVKKLGASSSEDLRQKLAVSQREADSFRTEINQIAASLAGVRDELKKAEKAAQKASADHEKVVEGLKADIELLKKTAQDLKGNASSASAEAEQMLANMKQAMEQRSEQFQQEKLQAAQESERALAAAASTHGAALKAQQAAHSVELDALAARMKEAEEARAAEAEKSAREVAALTAEHTRLLEEMGARHEVEATALKASLSTLQGKLQSMSEQADTERAALKADASKWEGKAKGLQKDLDARKKDNERAESVTSGLKNQVENLREELKASQKAFRDKMDMSAAKLEAEWQAKLDAQVAAGEKAVVDVRLDLNRQHTYAVEELTRRFEEDIKSLKSLLQKEHASAANELAENESMRQQLEASLKEEKAARIHQVSELTSTFNAQTRSAEEDHKQELERIKREVKSAAEAREALLTQSHNAEVERLSQLVEGTAAEYTHRMAVALEASKAAAEEYLRQKLQEQEGGAKLSQRNALDALSREHAEADRVKEGQFESERQSLTKNLADIREQFVDAAQQITSLEKVIAEERKERQRREETFVREKDQLLGAHDSDIRREREAAERRIIEVVERTNADIGILKGEHGEMRSQYEQRLQEMAGQYKALEKRYANRESREEDIRRIEQLLQEMVEKDELVIRTREEMQYFKREMLNREENYNQKFGSSPNVGVMQVIKPKDPAADQPSSSSGGGFGGGKSKPTQMRVINPNGGGMGGGMGIGGIGGGLGGIGGGSIKGGKGGK